MASDSTGLYIFGFILLLIIVFFAYGYLNPRLTADKRKQLIKAFKASAVIAKDAPALVQGTVTAPDVILPSTGEHVAYYGMFVLSKETSISETRKGIDIRVSGIPIDPNRTKIDSVQGFTFFETSGDFTVASGGTYYVVRPSTVFAYFKKGMDMVAGLVAGQAAAAGMPERVVRDNMDFTLAQTALKMFCGFEAPLVEDRSRSRSGSWSSTTTTQRTAFSVVTAKGWIDSRVHHFMAGYNSRKEF